MGAEKGLDDTPRQRWNCSPGPAALRLTGFRRMITITAITARKIPHGSWKRQGSSRASREVTDVFGHHPARQEPVPRSTHRPHPDGRPPCPTPSRAPVTRRGNQRTGAAALTSLLGLPRGIGAAQDPQHLPGGVCSAKIERPPCRALGLCCVVPTCGSMLALFSQSTSQTPPLEDQGRFQLPLKRLYFSCIFEDFFYLLHNRHRRHWVYHCNGNTAVNVHAHSAMTRQGAPPRPSSRAPTTSGTPHRPAPTAGSPRRGAYRGQAEFSEGSEEASADPSGAGMMPVLNSPSHLKPLERETASLFLSLLQTSPITGVTTSPRLAGWAALASVAAAPSTGAAAVSPDSPVRLQGASPSPGGWMIVMPHPGDAPSHQVLKFTP